MSEKADDSSSDDESESDTDSDSENSGSDESDASEISEVSGTEELKNEEEIKLRNHKRVKTNMESNEMNNGKPVNENDSSCEIIDIRSRSNSCSSTQKSNKRRMIDDDDENENEETDDNTAGKENIENKITSLSHDSKNPTSSSVNLNSSNQRNVKRKRQKEHPNLPSGMSHKLHIIVCTTLNRQNFGRVHIGYHFKACEKIRLVKITSSRDPLFWLLESYSRNKSYKSLQTQLFNGP